MKPLHVAILVAVSALAGAFIMKWQIGRNTVPVKLAPAAQLAPVQSQPAEPLSPPFADEKPRKEIETPRPARKPRRAAPVTMARIVPKPQETFRNHESNDEPAVLPAVQPAVAAPVALAAASEPPAQDPADPAPPTVVAPPAPAPPAPPPPLQVVLKADTVISARTVERLSSERNQAGDGFTATLDQPLVVDGWVIAERGAHLEGKVVGPRRTAGSKTSSDLSIVLTQLSTSDGQRIPIETQTFEKHGQSATAGEDVTKVAVGAVIGAAIGAIAGGGKGAGIGAGAGGAAGGGVAMATSGKPAVLPAETRITFRLRNPVTITERQNNKS